MKKIISLTLSCLMVLVVWGQDVATEDTLAVAKDSVSIGSHTEFAATKLSDDNVTKAQGDSAYMRNDYASAIQIYESLLTKGEAAEIYYNLGNSKISNFKVKLDNKEYTFNDNYDINASFDSKKYTNGFHYISNGIELCFGISKYGNNTYHISYDISNFVVKTLDIISIWL